MDARVAAMRFLQGSLDRGREFPPMPQRPHSAAFVAIRDRLLKLEENELARLARLFGAMIERQGQLGAPLRDALRVIAKLDDDDLERLAPWFSQHVSRWGWGQTPRDNSLRPRS